MNKDASSIDAFLAGRRFAVAGASTDRSKYGNKVLRALLNAHKQAIPINPRAHEVEGIPAYAKLGDIPAPIDGLSIITPPNVTEDVIDQALELGISKIWLQPGAESKTAIEKAKAAGAEVIYGGPCILVSLRFRE